MKLVVPEDLANLIPGACACGGNEIRFELSVHVT